MYWNWEGRVDLTPNIHVILERAGITVDELVAAINLAGGREPGKPILYAEICENAGCGTLFFSVTQDHYMRINNGFPTHCPSCREIIRRNVKAEWKRRRSRFTTWDRSLFVIIAGSGAGIVELIQRRVLFIFNSIDTSWLHLLALLLLFLSKIILITIAIAAVVFIFRRTKDPTDADNT